ncbi:MAG: exodeoxyribonuclease V subunit gamma [Rhodocyclaceae bacterium]
MFRLHLSNRIECLAERMLERLSARERPVFEADAIVVPGAGLRRWLELRIARRFGVCANVEFGFPARWIWQRIAALTGASPEVSPFDAALLAWRIYGWLGSREAASHPRLRSYLRAKDAAMRFELASRAAALIERYVTYRPDWLAAWARGEPAELAGAGGAQRADEAWQAAAWRAILAASGTAPEHPSERMFEAIASGGEHRLPAAVHVFGIPELPPLYLDILRRLALWMEVDLYLADACREHWFDIRSAKRIARLEARGAGACAETGNALLASWGEQSRALLGQALEAADWDFEDGFVVPEGTSLLARMQRAILALDEIPPGSLATACYDGSITVHVCHGLSREIEVLHDQLLARFAADATLTPGDVLVATPDLERAAPLIDAVFGSASGTRHIPYAILGRPERGAGSLTASFLELLDLPRTRFEASRLHDLLRVPAIARAFGLDEEGCDAAGRWLRETGMRWGLSAGHRRSLGVAEGKRHTLEASLASLLLGYALPAGASCEATDSWLHPDVEGRLAFHLGGLWRYARALERLRASLAEEHGAERWRRLLDGILEEFFAPGDEERDEIGFLREAIEDAAALAREGAGEQSVFPFEVFRIALEERLAAHAPGALPTGRVGFAGMSALRGIPYRLVCCIGMDHTAFPSNPPECEFDLMAAFPRAGDRRPRAEQRNVFLDLLLAAREVLYLSYTGRGIRDDRSLPPSVLVDELLESALRAAAEPQAARAALVLEHPLQAFSRRYFDGSDPRLFSYDAELCPGARPVSPAPAEAPAGEAGGAFFGEPLAPAEDAQAPVAIEDLARFMAHPAEFLLRGRLGLRLPREAPVLEDEDPFGCDFEAGGRLREHVLALLERGLPQERVLARAREHPDAPVGTLGEIELGALIERAFRFLEARAGAGTGAPMAITIDTGEGVLTGLLEGVGPEGMLVARFGPSGPRTQIPCWVRHLALCAAAPAGIAPRTRFIGDGKRFQFAPVEGAREHLAAMLRAYREGSLRPAHLFPRAGLAYLKKGSVADARSAWLGSDFRQGEATDPYYGLAFRGDAGGALDAEFERHAREILAPMRESLREDTDA